MATNKDFIVKNGLSVGGDVAITGNVTSDLHLNDNAKIKVGTATDGDLQIYHNVNNSFIEDVGTGSLYLRADASVRIQSYGDWGDMIKADKAGAVTLYHNNGSRLDTTASGVNVTGTVDMDGFTSVGNGTITGDVLIQKGSGFPRITLQDLDGTNTRAFIQYSANTLHLTSQNNTANGRIVFSRYDGTTTTTSGYFDATGKLFTSSDLDVSGNVVSSGNISAVNTTLTGYLRGPASFTIDPAAHGDDTGTVIIAGNLQVDGTQTTINSTSLTVDDLNLTLASGAADSAAANGAGITIDGASASLTYAHSGTKFVFNKPLDVTGNIGVTGTVDGVDIAARDAVLTSTTTTANAALPKAGGTMTGNLAINTGSPELYFGTTGNHYNWRIAAQELVDEGFEIAVGSQDTDYSNDTYVNKFVVKASGNVGIGTDNPQHKIHFGEGGGYYTSIGSGNSVPGGATPWLGIFNNTSIASATFGWGVYDSSADGSLQIWNKNSSTTGAVALTIKRGGNVGIGISVATSKLHVVGGDYGETNGMVRLVQNVATNAPTLFLEQTGQGGNANNNQGLLIKVDGQNTGQGNIIRAIGTNANVNGGNDVEALTVQNGGKVGIGTATPAANLHVKNTTTTTDSAVMVNRTETVFGWEEEWWFNARATSTSAGTAYLNFTFSGASTTNTHNMFIDYTFALYREHSTLGAIEGDSVHGTGSYQNNSSGGDVCRSGEAEVIGVGIVDNVYLEVTGSNAFRLAIVYEAAGHVKNISGKIKLLNNPATGSSPVVSIAV